MKTHLIIDIILILLALVIIMRCWKLGLVASLIRLAGTIVAYVSSWLLSGPISTQIYDRFVEKRLLDYAGSIIPPELQNFPPDVIDMATRFPEVRQQLTGAVNSAFADVGLDIGLPVQLVNTHDLGNRLIDNLLDGGSTVAEALVEVIMKPAALTLSRVLVFVVLFAIVSAIVSVLFRMGKVVNRLPLVGGLNRLGGVGVGVLEAAISLYIFSALILMASALLHSSDISFLRSDVLAQSSVLNWIMGWKLPSSFVMFP